MNPLPQSVLDWHDNESCHKHDTPSVVAEGSCCVCDIEEPCEYAVSEAAAYDEWACDWRAPDDRRCQAEATHGPLCGDHLLDALDDSRDEAAIRRAEASADR